MSRRKKKAKPDNRCCESCVNCLPVGDGDHICNMDPSKVVLEKYSFSGDYCWCGGSFGRRNRECITTNARYAAQI